MFADKTPNVISTGYQCHLSMVDSLFKWVKLSKQWQILLCELDSVNPALSAAGDRDQFKRCHICNCTSLSTYQKVNQLVSKQSHLKLQHFVNINSRGLKLQNLLEFCVFLYFQKYNSKNNSCSFHRQSGNPSPKIKQDIGNKLPLI